MRRLLTLFAAVLALAACGEEAAEGEAVKGKAAEVKGEVLVFAAASLRESLQELGASFERETGTRVVFNFAGSNDLARQIGAARGMDLFVSASEAWMDTVQRAGRVVEGTRRDLLSNALVVVGHASSEWTVSEPCALAGLPFKNLALGDPEAVPAGTYARTWMRSVRCGGRTLWEAVEARAAPAPDVRAALGLVLADPRVIGVVYRTDWMAFSGRSRVLHEVRGGPPIRYVLAQVAEGDNPEGARRFAALLAAPEGARVFREHGFTPLAAHPPAAP